MELFKLLGTVAIENDQAIKALDDTSKQASVTKSETADAFSKIGGVAAGAHGNAESRNHKNCDEQG